MENQQLIGVRETVPAFDYMCYIQTGRVQRTYEGHRRIIAAFASREEARKYGDGKTAERKKRDIAGNLVDDEYYYKLVVKARYDLVPLDVIPAILSSPS